MNLLHKSKKIMHVVNTFRTWNGPAKVLHRSWSWLVNHFGRSSREITWIRRITPSDLISKALYYKSCLLEFLVMINKLSLMILTSKNKVCSHFYPAIRYKYPQNFQTSQISLYLTKIFNQKWNFSHSFLGGLKIFHQTYRITINYWKTVSMIFKIFESILNP